MRHFSLCKIAQSEPSRARASTWRWQAQSEAALRCRRIRVQHESTWLPEGKKWPGRTCRPRLTRCVDGPASLSARQRPRGQGSGPNQEHHGTPGGTDNHVKNMSTAVGKQGPVIGDNDRRVTAGKCACAADSRSPIIAKKASTPCNSTVTHTCHSRLPRLAYL
jgi:hypothetical protein